MNTNQGKINDLRNVIYNSLDSLINTDYVLLDVPDYTNIGDSLIYAGELNYLKRLPYCELYSCSILRCQESRIPKGKVILFQGGGNFGDLYRYHQDFRNNIISKFKENRIIIFPQSIHYESEKMLDHDAHVHNSHPDLTICVRDKRSYNLLKDKFYNNNILLLPDMAFCLDIDHKFLAKEKNNILYMKRTDKEFNTTQDISQLKEFGISDANKIDVKDWPSFEATFTDKVKFKLDLLASKHLINTPLLREFIDPRYGIKGRDMYKKYTLEGIKFINNYGEIFSTRLHGSILAVLMGKKVHMIDNSYGKNSGFYNAWMAGFNNVSLISLK